MPVITFSTVQAIARQGPGCQSVIFFAFDAEKRALR